MKIRMSRTNHMDKFFVQEICMEQIFQFLGFHQGLNMCRQALQHYIFVYMTEARPTIL